MTPRPVLGYVPLAGTDGWRDGWVTDPEHAFPRMMRAAGWRQVRRFDGGPWRWTTFLDGVLGLNRTWEDAAAHLADFLAGLGWEDRNVFAHSHGGNVALLAATLVPLRSLTTVGTPRRDDVDYQAACDRVAYWQHLYDRRRDWTAWLGQAKLFDGRLVDRERSFAVLAGRGLNRGMVNHGVDGVGHSRLVRDERALHLWAERGWLEDARAKPDAPRPPDEWKKARPPAAA